MVRFGQREGTVAALHGGKIVDAVEQSYGEAEGIQEAEPDLREDGLGEVSLRVW